MPGFIEERGQNQRTTKITMSSRALPHIILIVMDSASASHCSAYGYHRDTTPGLQRLAAEAVLYKYCFSPAIWTIPAHASLFTGLYPGEHSCNRGNSVLPANCFTLPEILQQMGYHTIAVSSNLIISPGFQFNRGFSEYYEMDNLFNSKSYYDTLTSIKSFKKLSKNEWDRLRFIVKTSFSHKKYLFPLEDLINKLHRNYLRNIIASSSYATEKTIKIFQKILTDHPTNEPIFFFINFMETHYNYNPPRKYNNIARISPRKKKKISKLTWRDFYIRNGFSAEEIQVLRLLYDQELAYLDERLLYLSSVIEESGLAENCLLIITADHGECLGQHDLWGHAYGVYNDLIHIPLLIKYPASYHLTGESRNLVQLHDIFATIAEIIDFPYPVPDSSRSLFGPPRSFSLTELPVLQSDPNRLKRLAPQFQPWQSMQPCWALIDAELRKLILWADGRKELYDLKTDYDEITNLVNEPAFLKVGEALAQQLLSLISSFTAYP
jgi:arylsulfatase A-like enzyme